MSLILISIGVNDKGIVSYAWCMPSYLFISLVLYQVISEYHWWCKQLFKVSFYSHQRLWCLCSGRFILKKQHLNRRILFYDWSHLPHILTMLGEADKLSDFLMSFLNWYQMKKWHQDCDVSILFFTMFLRNRSRICHICWKKCKNISLLELMVKRAISVPFTLYFEI